MEHCARSTATAASKADLIRPTPARAFDANDLHPPAPPRWRYERAPHRSAALAMDLQLAGRRAVVTGGSKGIGKAIASALASEGCDVGIVARDERTLAAAAHELATSSGRKIVALPADTSSDESVARMAGRAREQLGDVEILVNAAATPSSGLP